MTSSATEPKKGIIASPQTEEPELKREPPLQTTSVIKIRPHPQAL
jgi:hypothetical protein